MNQSNPSPARRVGPSAAGEKLSRLLNDVAFYAHLIALRATVDAVRDGRLRAPRKMSSGAAIESGMIKLVGEIDQAAATLDDAVQALNAAVKRVEQLARQAYEPEMD